MIKILIAEHDPTDLEMIQKELFNGGVNYIAEVVKTETDFIEVLKTFIPDIILSDYTFPSFDGLAAFKIKEQLYPDTPFIIISGTIGEENSIELIKNGVTDFVQKERIFTLNTKITRALKHAEERKQKKKTDKELAKSENHLAEAQKLAKMGSWDYDIETGRLTASKELYNVFSVDPEKFSHTYDSYLNLIDEEDRLLVQQTTTHTHLTGAPFTLEYHITTAHGEKRIIREQGYGKKDETGKIIAVFGTAQDITATKKSEAAITKAYEEKNAVLESIDDGFFAIDNNSLVTYWNSKAEILLGEKRETVIGRNLHEMFTRPESRIFYENYQKAIEGKCTVHFEGFSTRTNKWFAVSAFASDNGLSVYFKDVTERKNAAEKIKESEAKYRSFFENSMDGILLTVTDGAILSANPAACEIFKMTEAEICTAGRFGIADLSDPRLYILLEERKKTGRAKGELTLLRKDGSKFEAELSSAVFINSNGLDRTCMIVRDISERKAAEINLIQTSKELQHTIHDLNNIMDSSMDIICTVNQAGNFIQVSAASQAIWGYSPQELINTNYIHLVYADDVEKSIAENSKIKNGVSITMFENRFVHKNGTIVPMLWSANWDEHDQLMYCIGKDATEKKRLEKANEIERQRFLDLYLQAPSCMGILKGAEYVYEMANPLYLKLIDKSDIIGKTVKEVLPEMEDQGIFEFLDTVYKTGNTFSANEMLVKFDFKGNGEMVDTYLNFIYQAHRNYEGEIDGILFFAIDVTEQVLSRRKIEASEKRYRQIVETAQEGIWMIDEDHKTTFVNHKMCQILEYTEAEMMGKEIYYFMDEEGKQIAAEFKEKIKQRHTGQINKKYLSKTGKEIWANVSVNPLFNEDGTSQGSLAMVTDITERKKIEVNLHESEKKYRQIVETAQEGIWLIDQDNKTTFVNNKMCEILAYTEAEMMGKEIYCFMDEEGKQIAAELMEKKKQGHSGQHNFKYLSKSGKEIWTNLSANPLFNADGTYQGSLAMVTDITESKMAEDRNQFQATLLNTIGQAAIATDMQGKINFWNKAASSIYGWTAEEVLGKNIVDITPAKQTKEQAEQIMHELIQGNTWSGEFMVRRKDGNEFPAFITNAPIYNQQQQLIGIVGVSYDITSRKQAEQQLKESNERYRMSEIQLNELNANLQVQAKELAISNADLEQFAYIASHDLQEPLRMITSFITQLQKKYGAVIDDKGKQYMEFVMDGAIRMRQIILDLLEFSRVGRAENMREDVDLNELIEEIQFLFRKQILEKKAIIISTRLPIINGFKSPVRQVFQNLISNALKYSATDKAVEIKITCTDQHDHWQFAVHDNGIGIEQEYFDKIFIIFQRLHNKEEFSGTGMGLAITKKIIEGQGGRIWVESEAGKGSTFYFTLLKATL